MEQAFSPRCWQGQHRALDLGTSYVRLLPPPILQPSTAPFSQSARFPSLAQLDHRGIWLLSYLVVRGFASIGGSSEVSPSRQHLWSLQDTYPPSSLEDHLGILLYHSLNYPKEPKTSPVSQAWKGEAKHDLVERCYQEYRQALTRYDPLPITLETPDTFYYHEDTSWDYLGTRPLLPEWLLTEAERSVLLPWLAQHLYWYNLKARGADIQMWISDAVPLGCLLLLTGNFLWLPALYGKKVMEELAEQFRVQPHKCILEADAFAALLGQGPALEYQLRLLQQKIRNGELKDASVPMLAERIGHLEALNEQERQLVRLLTHSCSEAVNLFFSRLQ